MTIPGPTRRLSSRSARVSILIAACLCPPLGFPSPADSEKTVSEASTKTSVTARLDDARARFGRREYKDALAVLEPLLRDAEAAGDAATIARVLFFTARSYYFLSDYRAAAPLFDRALEFSRKAGDRSFEGEILRGIGRMHKQSGNYPEGLRASAQSIEIYESLGQPRDAGSTWMTVGAIHDLSGEYDLALAAYDKARERMQSVKDADYYTLFNEIGITYTNLGRYEDALAAHMLSLEGRERSGDKYYIGISHSNIGDVYYYLGQHERAIEHYDQCVQLCTAVGERRCVAIALGATANAWIAAGNPARAIEYAERELALTREIHNEPLEGVALRHLGRAHAMLSHLDESQRFQEQALELARKSGARSDEADSLMGLAQLQLKRGNPARAAPLAQQALQLAEKMNAPDLDWETRMTLARASRGTGDTAKALDLLRASVEIIDSVRGRVLTDSGKIGYLDSRQAVYHELTETLYEGKQVREALETAEAARGRAFADLLVAQKIQLKPAASATLAEIRAAEAKLRALGADSGDGADARIAQTRSASETDLAGRLRTLRHDQPEVASLIAADPLRADEISAIARRLDATLVEYLVTERRLFIWVVPPGGEITGVAVEVGRDALRQGARSLHSRLNNLTAAELKELEPVRAELAQLHRWTIAPVAQLLPRDPAAQVYIVAHDALLLVPFAALVDEGGKYFAQRHTLAYVPSASVLRYTESKKRQVVSAERPHLLALADPKPPEGVAQEALPGTRTEIQHISRRFPADRRLALVGEQASEANLKRLAPGQSILHFAVHGLVRDDRPWESALLLAPGDGEDGWLRLPEVFGLDLHADLVVLSGCSTGLGKLSGDGIVGLSRGLIYAGTPSVVVSQWDVSDLSTAYLMDRFYAGIAAGRGKAEALRAAQLATQARYPHPALWAAFVLVGEPR